MAGHWGDAEMAGRFFEIFTRTRCWKFWGLGTHIFVSKNDQDGVNSFPFAFKCELGIRQRRAIEVRCVAP